MNTLNIVNNFKKELWEFKGPVIRLPLIIAAMVIAAPIIVFALMESYQRHNAMEVLTRLDGMQFQGFETIASIAATLIFLPFFIVSLFIQLHYFISCLYDERRDSSILFWRSLPVSDGQTVLTKLFTGMFVIPAAFLMVAVCTMLAALIGLFFVCAGLSLFYDVSIWSIWQHLTFFSTMFNLLYWVIVHAIWFFPLYAWFMLASVFANKAPFMWALLPIVIVLLIEAFIVNFLGLDGFFFISIFGEYFTLQEPRINEWTQGMPTHIELVRAVIIDKLNIWAILIGAGLVYATYMLRVRQSN